MNFFICTKKKKIQKFGTFQIFFSLGQLFLEGVVMQERPFSPRNFFSMDCGWGY
jgi:hypothetical protein